MFSTPYAPTTTAAADQRPVVNQSSSSKTFTQLTSPGERPANAQPANGPTPPDYDGTRATPPMPAKMADQLGQQTPNSNAKRKPALNNQEDGTASGKKRVRNSTDERAEKFAKGKDFYCWFCHKEKAAVSCKQCPRSFHPRCLTQNGVLDAKESAMSPQELDGTITCYNCKMDNQAAALTQGLKGISNDELNDLLIYAIDAVRASADPTFHHPVNPQIFPDYSQKIIHPMDLETIEKKAKNHEYKCVDSFLADIQWIVHNCILYNSSNNSLTSNAKSCFKLAGGKIVDLEICPDCYKNFHVNPDHWFTDVCRRPHVVVWHRLSGHPFWPGKIVRINKARKEADIRFFGAHDMAWVPIEACFLITENNCKLGKTKNKKLETAMNELNDHIKKVETKINRKFPYAPQSRMPVNPRRIFIPLDGEEEKDDEEEEEEQPQAELDESKQDGDGSAAAPVDDDEEEAPLQIDIKEPAPRKQAVATGRQKQKKDESSATPKHKANANATKQVGQSIATTGAKEKVALGNGGSSAMKQPTPEQGVFTFSEENALKFESFKNSEEKASSASNVVKEKLPAKRVSELDITGKRTASEVNTSNDAIMSKSKALINVESAEPDSSQLLSSLDSKAVDDIQQLQLEVDRLQKELQQQRISNEQALKRIRQQHTQQMQNAKQEWEKEKYREIMQIRAEMDAKHKEEIDRAKSKQWCAACHKEAIYYCCWNTSYCSYDCQTKHWAQHMNACQQTRQTQHQTPPNNGSVGLG